MLFAIDIDNTIARDIKNAALRAYLLRALDMPSDEADLRAWLQVPENLARFNQARTDSEKIPEVMSALLPIPGALDGVRQLASIGTVIYVTCRVPALYELTLDWLARHDFPTPENAHPCAHYSEKYLWSYKMSAPDEPIILIDDNAEGVVRSFQTIARNDPVVAMRLIPRLSVVAFAPKEARWRMTPPPFPVLILKSWEQDYLQKLLRVAMSPAVVK